MIDRRLLLAAVAGTAILAAFASQALPLDALRCNGTRNDIVKADYREHESKGDRRHRDEDGRYTANDRGRYGGDDDDDDDEDEGRAAYGDRGAPVQQNTNPPGNGLFTPGSKPRAQTN
ncbi:hypothetical protein J2046_001262 [Rhizobium petrolearium]|uniref:hypothetical protein n=1 Tax=Neorhizobium petrolearium TaxID=515361 RepID=UPI001AE145C3|nr:hypothetical protein [Neorhizobium petrolearium]MBP1843008.1 hypothetical protein [Neorhizobium petrolearium]